jgi:hypothetical protein
MAASAQTGTQLKQVVRPFGEVNVHTASGKLAVRATIQMSVHKEGAQTGIALDGSGSMEPQYSKPIGGGLNAITPVARKLCSYLARTVDQDGGTTSIYWATGPDGAGIQEIGDLTADQAEAYVFAPPKRYGGDTKLLPAVRYFIDRFKDAPWGMYVFITDGAISDLEPVKAYTVELARNIEAKRRKPVKLILVGVGSGVNEEQMYALDDLETGTSVDVWDHKIAADMRDVSDIFAEVVDANARVAASGRILAPNGTMLKNYTDSGVPALIEFEAPVGTDYFTLQVGKKRFHQPLRDGVEVPASDPVEGGDEEPVSTPAAATGDVPANDPAKLDPAAAMARFEEEVKLRSYDDRYVDRIEEKEVLQIAGSLGMSFEDARAALLKVCDETRCVVESQVVKQIKDGVAAAAGNDGKIDHKEFEQIFTAAKRYVRGKRNDKEVKTLIVEVMETTGNNKVKTGWFSNWYSDLKKELGLS